MYTRGKKATQIYYQHIIQIKGEYISPPPFEKKIENLKQLQGKQMKQIKEPFCLHANYIEL